MAKTLNHHISRRLAIWRLLLSHHPPSQYSRTLRFAIAGHEVRLCARCTGEAIGLILALGLIRDLSQLSGLWLLALVTVLPLPAIVDWSTQAMEWRESSNGLRLITGAIFASGCVILGLLLAIGCFWYFCLGLLVLVSEGIIALRLLQRAGMIDRVLAPFEDYAQSLQERTG